MIDTRAIVHPTAKLADNVSVGPFAIIGADVTIGEDTEIGPHSCIGPHTTIGHHNKIYAYASVGSDPQHIAYQGEITHLNIGDHNVIREFVTINRGTREGRGTTVVGNHNYLMAYCHVAHDCVVGNHVVFANTASLAGHVHIGDHVILGAFSGIHQYVRIGSYSFLGRGAKVYQDILPYMLVTGNPGIPTGLNAIGLRRHGFTSDVVRALKRAYSLIYRRELKMEAIQAELQSLAQESKEVGHLLEMITSSTRGIARSQRVDMD